MSDAPSFTDYIELHERKWGDHDYQDRPTLKQLLNAPIVVMWRCGKRFKLTIHESQAALNDFIVGLVTGLVINEDQRTLYKAFYDKEEVSFSLNFWLNIPSPINESDLQDSNGPRVIDVNPQREIRKIPPATPNYIPTVLETNPQRDVKPHNGPHYMPKKINGVQTGKVFSGRNDAMKPGRNAGIIRTPVEDRKPKK